MKGITMAAIALGIAGLAIGGYFLQGKVKCYQLEQDYLNDVDSLRSNAIARVAVPGNEELQSTMDRLEELQLKSLQISLDAVYEQCGERAGQSAARKGGNMVFGR